MKRLEILKIGVDMKKSKLNVKSSQPMFNVNDIVTYANFDGRYNTQTIVGRVVYLESDQLVIRTENGLRVIGGSEFDNIKLLSV